MVGVSDSSRDLVIGGGDSKLLVETRTKQCVQLLAVHCLQTPHRQLMCHDIVQ